MEFQLTVEETDMTESDIRKVCNLLGLPQPESAQNGWMVLPCPFAPHTHARGTDRNPSFRMHANPTGRTGFHCFSCQEHGNMADLVMRLTALNEGQSDLRLAAQVEIMEMESDPGEFEEGSMPEAKCEVLDPAVYFAVYPNAWGIRIAREYLLSRGVTEEAAAVMELRYDPEFQRVMFPVMDEKRRLFGFVGRSVSSHSKIPKFTYPPLNKSKHIMGAHLARPGFPKVVVEGQFAYAHLIAEGVREFCDVVATMGSKLSEAQAGWLADQQDPVYLLYDDDAAGNQGLFGKWNGEKYEGGGAVDMLEPEVETYVIDMPPECKGDPDNLLAQELYEAIFPDR